MRSYSCYFAFVSVLAFFSLGCDTNESNKAESPSNIVKEKVIGHWDLVSAKRDGKSTRVLDNTFFEFTQDSMQTNFPSKEGRYSFKTINNEIVTQEDSPTFYKVQSLKGDTMGFSVKLRGYLFEMTLAARKSQNKISEDL
ncbi:MAG TPA: hypothetical protein VJ951_08360 [Bacteroidales bacterium]|nr:hypothetical protein [Bacteroidales bacterium]